MSASLRRALTGAAALGLGAVAIAAFGPSAEAAPIPETFEYTGEAQTFAVPDDICSVTVDALGAEGGFGHDAGPGGLGGQATASIGVTPGETLFVYVGGQGGPALVDNSPADEGAMEGDTAAGSGGFNGGGDGGGNDSDPGGGGGGASDVRQGGDTPADRVVVAGGGGGSGGDNVEEGNSTGFGGDGGGVEGSDGQDSQGGSQGGGGGTQTLGGAFGAPDSTATSGSSFQGGQGGEGNDDDDGGGGGGGGYFGGGGGSGDFDAPVPSPAEAGAEGLDTEDGGGGGGGSGFGPAGVDLQIGVHEGNGLVTITYDPDTDACEPDVEPDDDVAPDVVEATPPFTG